MKTAIMTDTNSGISVEEGRELGIYVLPMPEMINGKFYLEGQDLSLYEFYDLLEKGADASSSQPSPEELIGMFDRILSEGYDDIVYIPMSSGLSGSYETALSFAREYGGRVQVADNHRISQTLRDACNDALKLKAGGLNAVQIRERLEANAFNQVIYITVQSVKRLVRTGRVTAAGAAVADILNLKPVLQINGEKLDAFAKARGMKQAEKIMMDAIRCDITKRFGDTPIERLSLNTATSFVDKEKSEEWKTKVQETFPEFNVTHDLLSASICCHLGANACGIAVSVVET